MKPPSQEPTRAGTRTTAERITEELGRQEEAFERERQAWRAERDQLHRRLADCEAELSQLRNRRLALWRPLIRPVHWIRRRPLLRAIARSLMRGRR